MNLLRIVHLLPMCFALLLQAILQVFALTFLLRQLLQGCSCGLLAFTAMSPIPVRQLLDSKRSMNPTFKALT